MTDIPAGGGRLTDQLVGRSEIVGIMNLLRPRVCNQAKVRIGGNHDGGYVVPALALESNLLISIGIGDEISFDTDFAMRGAKVHQFDHTITRPPGTHPNMCFHGKGWGATGDGNLLDFRQIVDCADWTEARHPVLKFDVEGAEWEGLLALDSGDLARFEIVVGEIHNLERIYDADGHDMVRRALEKLCRHHVPIHFHGNNYANVYTLHGVRVPGVIELTLLRKDSGVFSGYSDDPIPGSLDRPNNPASPDIRVELPREAPLVPGAAPLSGSKEAFGINLIGNLTGNHSLGVIIHGIASLLTSRKVPFAICDVPYAWGDHQRDSEFSDHVVRSPEALEHPVNLYVLPASFYETLFQANPGFLEKERLHVANIWWEASRLPPRWLDVLARFDGILAMSGFIADICRNSLPMTPTLYGEAPLALPRNIRSDRKAFGLPEDAVVFVASLDPNSDPERKNPEALVAAFRAAFPATDRDVRLVIRLNNAATDFGQLVIRRLQQIASGDGRIALLLGPMRYDQVLSLYATSDVYLSFHRGEGLGLGMLESMALGKAVIATGWSGNLSFMNNSNSALMRYRLVPVSGHYDFFRPEVIGHDARWADPVLDDAVAWMRHLRHDTDHRNALGERARVSALEYQRKAGEAHWLDELDDLRKARQYLPRVVEKLSYPAFLAKQPTH